MGPTRRWAVYPICALKIPEGRGNVKGLPEGGGRGTGGPASPLGGAGETMVLLVDEDLG